jgi:hypothetical protein
MRDFGTESPGKVPNWRSGAVPPWIGLVDAVMKEETTNDDR